LLKNIGFSLIAAKRTIDSITRKNADRKEDDIAIQIGIKFFVQCIKNNAKTEEVDNITTAVGWLINNKGMVGTTLLISDNKTCGHGGSKDTPPGDDISNNWAPGDGGEMANDGGHERKVADYKDDGDSDASDEILKMSDGKSEESDRFFGIDDSTNENKNDVEVPVGDQIDDDDPLFADADDHNEGEKNDNNKNNNGNAQDDNDNKKGEGAIEGSNKPEDKPERLKETELFYNSSSDSDSRKDNETEGRNKDKKANMIQEGNDNDQLFGKDHHNVRT
jgi:hypothetical protein